MRTDETVEDIKKSQHDAHRDPLSGKAGSHPIGTGVGAATGGVIGGVAAGAAIGTIAGPVGTLAGAAAGAAVGAFAGGLAGKAVAEDVDPTIEHGFWRSTYSARPYVKKGTTHEDYAPAYQYGWESHIHYQDRTFEESEPILARDWPKHQGRSTLTWEHAKDAAHDSWERIGCRKPSSSNK
ncbi:MAG: hypothetical protein ACP5I8_12635 [Phycisphaerae bacterium]